VDHPSGEGPYPPTRLPRLRITRASGPALTEGIEIHRIEGAEVRIYSAAKTVADCFKHRNKVGLDVAIEALRDFTRDHRGGATELSHFAAICRVTRVIQPYWEAIA
jgi:predicted transcriptional regulator of viral defense system